MLCISAVYAVMRCLSVTFVDHVKTNKHIFEIYSPSGSHTILVFPYQMGWRYSDGNPPNGGVECRWGIGRNGDSGLIAGYQRLLDVRSAKNIYQRQSWVYDSRPRTTGYRSIAGCVNHEVTKTVTDDHAVQIAQSATHQQILFVTAWSMDEYAEEKRTEKNLIVRSWSCTTGASYQYSCMVRTAAWYLRRMHARSMHSTSGICVCCLASNGTNLYGMMMYGG